MFSGELKKTRTHEKTCRGNVGRLILLGSRMVGGVLIVMWRGSWPCGQHVTCGFSFILCPNQQRQGLVGGACKCVRTLRFPRTHREMQTLILGERGPLFGPQ